MSNILIFGGTGEGRIIASACERLKISAIVSVATEYGKDVLPDFKYVKVENKRLNQDEICSLIKKNNISFVIDATHPYAFEISKNISASIELLKEYRDLDYLKISREQMDLEDDNRRLEFKSSPEAANFLINTGGNILLTTGSKDIDSYRDLGSRIFPRVLPSVDSINACINAGIPAKNIIAMQGPFSKELNMAIIKEFDCKYLVTKLSGKSGGFYEKIKAAEDTNCIPVIILPKENIKGISVEECVNIIEQKYGNKE